MTELPDLKQLSDEAKDALILTLWEELQKLQKKRPKKTSKHASLPPAKGFKAEVKSEDKEGGQIREGSRGREGGGRRLSEPPDQIIESTIKTCSDCGTAIAKSDQHLMGCDLNLILLQGNRKTILVELLPKLTPPSWR